MRRKTWFFLTLALFCAVAGAVDFFHVEKGFATDYNCPACLFHTTYVAALYSLVLAITIVLALLLVLVQSQDRPRQRGRLLAAKNKSPPVF